MTFDILLMTMKTNPYDPAKIEKKWQKKWTSSKLYRSKESAKKKYYVLDMFPYPSGEGLHVGHPKGYIATDVISRMKRMQGMNVLHPMGFDAFGLPAENYALKMKMNPMDLTVKNVKRFKEQLEILGFDYDWSREVNTTDPKYYKWTQWIFLQLLKKGLAYESFEPINWCPSCKTGLANEDVEDGHCERCGTLVERKPMRQWVLKITDYAERLLNDLYSPDLSDSPHIIDKKWPPRPGKKVVERRTIHAMVKDPKTGKYLGLKWKKFPWITFIVGGVEDGEDIIDAARREVEEETGYHDLKFVRILGNPVKAEYYAAHKDQNRIAITSGVLFELASDSKKDIHEHEKDAHETIWMDPKDMNAEVMTCAELPVWLERLPTASFEMLNGEPCFTQILEPGTVRKDLPFVERNAIMAIVKHWSENKYIGLKWKKVNWRTLITGGPENNQTVEEGAIAEIKEETGYLHPKLIKNLGKVHSKFFHVPKNVNRFAHFDVLYFELENGEREEISDEEKVNHEMVWLSPEEMATFLTPESHKYVWSKMFLGIEPKDSINEIKNLLDWPESIKEAQKNWIGKSEGAEIQFTVKSAKFKVETQDIEVFTTRPDTIFGATYVVLAPEHKLISELLPSIENKKEVEDYIFNARQKTEIDRTDAKKEKTGVELKGIKAINPANKEEIPVWISDYVLTDYGTGAVMAVPAHDERDWEFAKKFGLAIKQVVAPLFTENSGPDAPRSDKKDSRRRNVLGIVKHWSEDKYICLNWKQTGWHSLIVGGTEDKEDDKIACEREIIEETGYKNLKFIRKVGPEVHTYHYTPHKDQNRYGYCQALYFELKDGEQNMIDEHEKSKHEVVWIEKNKVANYLNLKNNLFLWDIFLNGEKGFVDNGILINSDQFNDKESHSIKKEITSFVGGKCVTKYKLRDWVFSRQRYWGEPIPVIHCNNCAIIDPSGKGIVPVPEKDLPVKLPKVKSYEPTGTGESPLAAIDKWVNVKCPVCGGKAKRETNTMPQWAGSSWYYLRYEDPKNNKRFVDPKKEKYWSPVDIYIGGAEHATRHLIYARFWHKFLYDIDAVSDIEPFKKLQSVGLIMGEDGRKMSKRFGNVINPDDIVKTYGADTLRIYEMFMGPFDQQISWSTNSMIGARRFIEKVWKLREKVSDKAKTDRSNVGSKIVDKILHKTIKKVTDDINDLKFNTAISTFMIAVNELEKMQSIEKSQFEILLKLLAPFAPHVTEELWGMIGNKKSIHISNWPSYDPTLIIDQEIRIIVQVNGKVRGSFITAIGKNDDELRSKALEMTEIKKWLDGKKIEKVIVIPNRLINIVIS